ncbi:MAG: radical SAM/SPASM domain-containing protein [Oscillospiraceae bacterium]
MTNPYLPVNRLEFTVTLACTSRCRHCSRGGELGSAGAVDKAAAVRAVKELAAVTNLASVMTFGGEPLLRADTTCAILRAAAESGVGSPQIITNGFFSREEAVIDGVAKELAASGVKSILLSVDGFHAEHVPMEYVRRFAEALLDAGAKGLKLHPAWVVNRAHRNPHNAATETALEAFADLGIPVSGGNDIFPAGNAAKHLAEYYPKAAPDLDIRCGEAPYTDPLDAVTSLSVNPNGDVVVCDFVIGNIEAEGIGEIVARYNPYAAPAMAALLKVGVRGLMDYGESRGVSVNSGDYTSACGVCHAVQAQLQRNQV